LPFLCGKIRFPEEVLKNLVESRYFSGKVFGIIAMKARKQQISALIRRLISQNPRERLK